MSEPIDREIIREVITALLANMSRDPMIGFHFSKVDLEKLAEHEFAFACDHLLTGSAYLGRPLDSAHRPHRISRGHFGRRMVLLEKTLAECGVDPVWADRWLRHERDLMDLISRPEDEACGPSSVHPVAGKDPS